MPGLLRPACFHPNAIGRIHLIKSRAALLNGALDATRRAYGSSCVTTKRSSLSPRLKQPESGRPGKGLCGGYATYAVTEDATMCNKNTQEPISVHDINPLINTHCCGFKDHVQITRTSLIQRGFLFLDVAHSSPVHVSFTFWY